MELIDLITRYGLIAVFLGSVLEGETVLLLAGYAAHRGYLDFAAVVAVAWLGATLGDQVLFWLGRRHGRGLAARRPALAGRIERALALIEAHPLKIIFAMRFLWGMRTALPIALGLSRVSGARFLVLNPLAALLWAPLVAGLGWGFGALITRHLGDIARFEHWLFAGVIGLALAAHGLLRLRRKSGPGRR